MPAKQTIRWPKRRVARSLRPPGQQQSRLIPFQAGSDQAAAALRPVDQAGRFPESLTFLRQGEAAPTCCVIPSEESGITPLSDEGSALRSP